MKRMIMITACILSAIAVGAVAARATALRGNVQDAVTGHGIGSATVLITGTSLGATTDLDGNFTILFVPAGAYGVQVSCEGYEAALVKGVDIGERGIVEIEIKLQMKAVQEFKIDDLIVSADRVLTTEAATLAERQLAATIGDAISVETIAKSPDATSSDILKRVTGLSIVDNKFVFIRGVTDRYNGTMLDGASITSTDTEVDKKSFTYDIIPSNLIASTTVVKTPMPDLPGDFSGGLVQIRTLEFPEERLFKISASNSYDEKSSTRGFYGSQGGSKDWLGYDDGSRALPPGDLKGNNLARALKNNWLTRERKAPLNANYSITAGNNHLIGSTQLGYVAALMYRTDYQAVDFIERPTYRGFPLFSFEGTRYRRSVLWSGLLNLNWKLTSGHKVSWRNSYTQSGQEAVSISAGLPASGEYTDRQTIKWNERTLHLMQASGSHAFQFLWNLAVDWQAYRSESKAAEPDRRHVEFQHAIWTTFKENYRTWSTLDESSRGMGIDLALPLGPAKVKSGWLGEWKKREFGIDAYSTDPSMVRSPNYELLILPIAQVFAPENYGPDKFSFVPITLFTGEYSANQRLGAWYAMLDAPCEFWGQRVRLAGGVRTERSVQEVNTVEALDNQVPITTRIDKTDALPSVAFTYSPASPVNIRLAYSKSVNRPEFREMANVLYYDLERSQDVLGNPHLKRAAIRNYDARFEVFPSENEIVAVSYFYKDIEDAIEERLLESPERYLRTWFNSPTGKNHGWEFEVRQSLGFFARFLEPFSITGNYTRVFSAIEYQETHITDDFGGHVTTIKTRAMQGQAPWTANLSLLFSKPSWGTSINVLLNKVGRRLDAVGDTRNEDVYEESRQVVDLAMNQHIGERWEAKLSARNIGAVDQTYTSGPLSEISMRLSRSVSYSISLSLKF
jgi:outer membrane receptor protein involved in Fe transport